MLVILALLLQTVESVDPQMIARIKMEGFQNSQVMDTLSYLTDVHGPRLTRSPGYQAAAAWSRDKLKEWGLAANLEPWGEFGRGWSIERFSVEMTTPQYMRVIAYPKAWTPSLPGPLTGKPLLVEVKSKEDFEQYRGKLKGALVMNGKPVKPEPHFKADAQRLSDEELRKQLQVIEPGEPKNYWLEDEEWKKDEAKEKEITRFFREEGVAVLLEPSTRDHGVVRVSEGGSHDPKAEPTFPGLVVAKEHYNRIARLLEKNLDVQLEISIKTRFHEEDTTGYNVVAEIPGTDPKLKDQVVMLGGHLDSWHSGTGATDNAAGCAVVMEAVRILQAIGARPRRTLRLALWGGEEQGYLGSLGYVKKHLAIPGRWRFSRNRRSSRPTSTSTTGPEESAACICRGTRWRGPYSRRTWRPSTTWAPPPSPPRTLAARTTWFSTRWDFRAFSSSRTRSSTASAPTTPTWTFTTTWSRTI